MPSKLTINAYISWIIKTNGLSQQTSKGVAVSTDGAITEGQFIQTLTIFNVEFGQKGVITCCALPTKITRLALTHRGAHSKENKNRHVKGELGSTNIMCPAT